MSSGVVSARFGADGMSLLLLPGEAERGSPPRVLAAANHNPWFETAAGAESISQRDQVVTHPLYERVHYCAVEDELHGWHESSLGVLSHSPGHDHILGFQFAMSLSYRPRSFYSDCI